MDTNESGGAAAGGVRIACQTITWGEEQRHHFPAVFAEVAAAGYEGVEIGFRHIRTTPPETLRGLLDQNALVLAASHIGGNLEDPAQADAERSVLDEVLAYLDALGCGLLMYSGLRYNNDEQFATDFARLNRAALRCQEACVRLLYHNHDWEFADADGRVAEALLTQADPALGFCPDIGWVQKGGADVPAFLDRAKARIGAIHFKDFAGPERTVDTVVLGEGIAPLPYAAEWMQKNMPAGSWAIAEQDRADLPAAEAATRNARYLKGLFV